MKHLEIFSYIIQKFSFPRKREKLLKRMKIFITERGMSIEAQYEEMIEEENNETFRNIPI